jgi:isopentenyl-diphosphate delta-isomerase
MMVTNAGVSPRVILVDEHDNVLGYQEKLRAHLGAGQLHRAFSIFVLDDRDRLLLQRRASSKYHCPGLWANSCCSHPQPGIPLLRCARLRLQEELGFSTPLVKIGAVQYQLALNGGLTEREFDHIFLGRYAGWVYPNPDEVQDYKWVSIAELEQDLQEHVEKYTPWLPKILPVLRTHLKLPGTACFAPIASNG